MKFREYPADIILAKKSERGTIMAISAKVRMDLGGRVFVQKLDIRMGADVRSIPLRFKAERNGRPAVSSGFENGLEIRPFQELECDPLRLHDSWSAKAGLGQTQMKLGLRDISREVVRLSCAMPSMIIDMGAFADNYPAFTKLAGYVPQGEDGLRDFITGVLPLGFNLLLLEGPLLHSYSNVSVPMIMRQGMKYLLTSRALLDIKVAANLRADASDETAPLPASAIINAAERCVLWKGVFENIRFVPQLPEQDDDTDEAIHQIG